MYYLQIYFIQFDLVNIYPNIFSKSFFLFSLTANEKTKTFLHHFTLYTVLSN